MTSPFLRRLANVPCDHRQGYQIVDGFLEAHSSLSEGAQTALVFNEPSMQPCFCIGGNTLFLGADPRDRKDLCAEQPVLLPISLTSHE